MSEGSSSDDQDMIQEVHGTQMHGDLDLCLPPSGVITTHCVSSVIRPGRKSATDPLQFVKIQAADLSKKAKEQIRLAEEVKITKEKIKEVEEEWQSNLLNWKSKRRVNHSLEGDKDDNHTGDGDENGDGKRKIKTFSEILNEKAKSGHRIGYNLHRYGYEDEDDDDISAIIRSSSNNNSNDTETSSSLESEEHQQMISQSVNGSSHQTTSEGKPLIKKSQEDSGKKRTEGEEVDEREEDTMICSKTGSSVRVNGRESSSASHGRQPKSCQERVGGMTSLSGNERQSCDSSSHTNGSNHHHHHHLHNKQEFNSESQKNVWNYLIQQQEQEKAARLRIHADDPTELDDDDDDEEEAFNDSGELEENDLQRQEQLINFRAKLSAFENLAKSEKNHVNTSSSAGGLTSQRDLSSSASSSASSSTSGHHLHPVRNSSSGVTGGQQSHAGGGVTLNASSSRIHHQIQNGNHGNESQHPFQVDPMTRGMDKLSVSGKNCHPSSHHQMQSSSQSMPQRPPPSNSIAIHHQRDFSSASNGSLQHPSQVHLHPMHTSSGNHGNLLHQVNQGQTHPMVYSHHQVIHHQLPLRSSMPVSSSLPQQQLQQHLTYHPQSHVRSHSQQLLFDQQNQYANQPTTQQHYYVLEEDFRTGKKIVVQEPLYSNQQPPPSSLSTSALIMPSSSNPAYFPKPYSSSTSSLPSVAPQKSLQAANSSSSHGIDPRLHQHQPHLQQVMHPPPVASFHPQTPLTANNSNGSATSGVTVSHPPSSSHPPLVHPTVSHSGIPSSMSQASSTAGYNKHHWLIQEAELRRQIQAANNNNINNIKGSVTSSNRTKTSPTSSLVNNEISTNQTSSVGVTPFKTGDQRLHHQMTPQTGNSSMIPSEQIIYENFSQSTTQSLQPHHHLQQSSQQQKQSMLSVSGRKKCSSCNDELGRGCAAMVIESLSLYYHINCFRCSVCHIQLGNGTCGTDVRVRNHKLHCNNCYSNDEEGLKFSRV